MAEGTIGNKIKFEENKKLLENPRVRSMLNTIAYAEGADYNTRVGGGTFSDLSKKPGKSTYIKSIGSNSTAEGRYQFLNSTWDSVARDLSLPDFSPQSQDIAAVELIKRRGALSDVLAGNLEGAVSKLNKEWASLPTKSGGSAYGGQRARSLDTLRGVFNSNGGNSTYSGEYGYSEALPSVGKFINYGEESYSSPSSNLSADSEEAKPEETKEETAAKERIDKATAEQQIMQNYLAQNAETQVQPQQQEQQQVYEAPSIGEQFTQVSQLVDNPIVQEGGNIPVSSRGVYDYPEQEVIVPTKNGHITMANVPYPILGIDEFGNKKMMHTGEEHQFPGKVIHEIPLLKNYFNKR